MTKSKPNAFASASAVKVEIKEPGAKKSKKVEVPMGSDLDDLARIDALSKALEGRREAIEARLKAKVRAHFCDNAIATGLRPDNFTGVGQISSSSCENRQRSSTSKLTDEEIARLKLAGLPVGEVTDIDIPGRFFFNEEVLALGDTVLEKITAALAKIKELDGIEVIKYQTPVKKTKTVVTEETIAELCKTRDSAMIKEFAPMVTVQALKPKINDGVAITAVFDEMRKAFETVTGVDAQEAKEI